MSLYKSRLSRWLGWRPATGAASVLVCFLVLLPSSAQAIPAFARQFGVTCGMCHAPVPPRLNALGLTFKRLGFRMPDVDDKGNIILKDKPSRSVSDDVSLIGDFRAASHRDEPTLFSVDSAMARGGGAVGQYFSYAGEVEWMPDEGFDVSNLEGQILLGGLKKNVTARFGILNPLIWDRSDHTIGVSEPLLLSTPVPVGDFSGSAIGDSRTGIELGFNFNHGGTTHNTFVGIGVFNRLDAGESPATGSPGADMSSGETAVSSAGLKDVLVQAVHVFGYSNTIGALWYHGSAFDIGPGGFDDRIDRVALMGNYVLPTRTDLVAAVGFGRDRPASADLGEVNSRGWFVEADQTVATDTVAYFRFDRFEPDKLNVDVRAQGPTVGVTRLFLRNLLVGAEYQGLRTGSDMRGRDLVIRAVLLY